jgi:hypothetical protein
VITASVQTAADAAPMPLWLYALGAMSAALTVASPWLLAAYLDSNFHRRGVARLRAHRQRQEHRS